MIKDIPSRTLFKRVRVYCYLVRIANRVLLLFGFVLIYLGSLKIIKEARD